MKLLKIMRSQRTVFSEIVMYGSYKNNRTITYLAFPKRFTHESSENHDIIIYSIFENTHAFKLKKYEMVRYIF